MLRTYWFDAVDPLRELTSLHQWMDQTLQQTLNSFAQTWTSPQSRLTPDGNNVSGKS
jgi:hypothetical protein